MKYEWRKSEKQLYTSNSKPLILNIPKKHFICISGKGNPSNPEFSDKISVLYSLAYQIKNGWKAFALHHSNLPYHDFTVYPLEGKWTSTSLNPLEKDCFYYTLMIAQPDFITEEIFYTALQLTKIKKPHPLLQEIEFAEICDGTCVQMLHIGSYDTESETFNLMNLHLQAHHLKRADLWHREIYFSNPRKTSPDKRKTLLRYQIES